jgi:hypothetical protein
MSKQTAAKGESAKQVAIDVPRGRRAAGAMEVAKRVIDSGRCSGLKGKTPGDDLAMLAAAKPGGPFKRVGKGTYTLADRPARPTNGSGTHKGEASPHREAEREAARRRQAAKRTA